MLVKVKNYFKENIVTITLGLMSASGNVPAYMLEAYREENHRQILNSQKKTSTYKHQVVTA